MKLGVRRQIWALPAIAVLIFGIGIAIGISFASQALVAAGRVATVDYPRLDGVKAISVEVTRLIDDFNGAVSEGEKAKLAEASTRAERIRGLIVKLGLLPGQRALADRLGSLFDGYYTPAQKAASLMLGVEKGDLAQHVPRMQAGVKALNEELEQAARDAAQGFNASLAGAEANIRHVLVSMIGSAIVVVLALVVVSWFIVRTIWKQLGGEPEYARRIVQEIARGNLAVPIDVEAGDTRSQLAALQGMRGSLVELISNIRGSAATVREASNEIAQGMTELSSRTEQQAASLEETASTMEELTSTVTENADNAVRARELAQGSTQVATRGGEIVRDVVKTMDEIDASSSQIASIAGVIDGIAFQTNILALNAAVEASRAGEHGRGFAVVAQEVRNLAQRSAASAKEVKDLIETSLRKVGQGRKLVSDAGTTMERIVESIGKVSEGVKEISSASIEQSSGIGEIGRAVTQIEGVTQHNASLLAQASAAARSMSEQARSLEDAVRVFRLVGDGDEGEILLLG